MRPLPSSPLRYPLDRILGAEANVRILRVLLDLGPQSAAGLARHAGLTRAGTRRAVDRLVRFGIVENRGGTRGTYSVPETHPFRTVLAELFSAERLLSENLLRDLRDRFGALDDVRAAWIATEPQETGEPLEIRLLVEPRSLPHIRQEIRQRMLDLEHAYLPRFEFEVRTPADVSPPKEPVVFLKGPHLFADAPVAGGSGSKKDRHARALADSRRIARLLRGNPELVTRALHRLRRLLREDPGTARTDLAEWLAILETHSPSRIGEILTSGSPRSERLRQSSPFPAVLTMSERQQVESPGETS